jgi:hypothetical protein
MVDALTAIYPTLVAGAVIPTDRWGRRKRCAQVDALLPDLRVVVEYDGSYFHHTDHAVKRDTAKTTALIRAGYRVIRVRDASKPTEFPLPPLPIDGDEYVEVPFNPDTAAWNALADQVRHLLG